MSRQYLLQTSHGHIALEESGHGSQPVVLIHGNSSCRAVFRHQMQGEVAEPYRFLAFDLPGHGQSSNAIDPVRTYTRPGFADATIELLAKLGVDDVVLVGWSLGGHIALEVAAHFRGVRGIMICGTPPVGRDMSAGFIPAPHMRLGSQQEFSGEDIETFGHAIFGDSFSPELRAAIARADGLARKTMFEAARAGAGVDQRALVASLPVPLAVVNGANDRFVNLDYVDSVAYANLWEDRCLRLPDTGHAPFREAPALFDPVLARFLREVVTQKV
ncbi:alpha/beta fold hydrolase [Cupriavidus pampae]|uniref:2-succinyl-6-hydroxy-2, 4-cyclohexadiene-1-carboxylate synthase n=1 Tax=Cupriavidus pampae TaxID=659251 RepID=A0ABN7XTG8_9BURK|nr:alpha/beta hydrolase [Cupriavidus pampae]CAG9164205.1 2-succinyl-6-hydroxy-2, 4-cyclohexadiene-1-carboxylate synthase [Cupriavidus pampae]